MKSKLFTGFVLSAVLALPVAGLATAQDKSKAGKILTNDEVKTLLNQTIIRDGDRKRDFEISGKLNEILDKYITANTDSPIPFMITAKARQKLDEGEQTGISFLVQQEITARQLLDILKRQTDLQFVLRSGIVWVTPSLAGMGIEKLGVYNIHAALNPPKKLGPPPPMEFGGGSSSGGGFGGGGGSGGGFDLEGFLEGGTDIGDEEEETPPSPDDIMKTIVKQTGGPKVWLDPAELSEAGADEEAQIETIITTKMVNKGSFLFIRTTPTLHNKVSEVVAIVNSLGK